MSGVIDRSIPPPDGIDPKVSDWIKDSSGNDAVGIAELKRFNLNINRKGSWTPSITFDTPGDLSLSAVSAWGEYRRSGRYIELWGTYTATITFTTATGGIGITGIPRAASNSDANFLSEGTLSIQGVTKAGYTSFTVAMAAGNTALRVIAAGSGMALDTITPADIGTGGTLVLRFHISYRF